MNDRVPTSTRAPIRDAAPVRPGDGTGAASDGPATATPAIQVSGVVKQFGDVCALDHLDLVVPAERAGYRVPRVRRHVQQDADTTAG